MHGYQFSPVRAFVVCMISTLGTSWALLCVEVPFLGHKGNDHRYVATPGSRQRETPYFACECVEIPLKAL